MKDACPAVSGPNEYGKLVLQDCSSDAQAPQAVSWKKKRCSVNYNDNNDAEVGKDVVVVVVVVKAVGIDSRWEDVGTMEALHSVPVGHQKKQKKKQARRRYMSVCCALVVVERRAGFREGKED